MKPSESIRTLLFTLCLVGLWLPPLWLVGAVVTVRALRDAPASWHKRGMWATVVLVPVWLLLFVVAMVALVLVP